MIENFGLSMTKDDRSLKLTVSEDESMKSIDFLHVDIWSQKLKADQKYFGWVFVKNEFSHILNILYILYIYFWYAFDGILFFRILKSLIPGPSV